MVGDDNGNNSWDFYTHASLFLMDASQQRLCNSKIANQRNLINCKQTDQRTDIHSFMESYERNPHQTHSYKYVPTYTRILRNRHLEIEGQSGG